MVQQNYFQIYYIQQNLISQQNYSFRVEIKVRILLAASKTYLGKLVVFFSHL